MKRVALLFALLLLAGCRGQVAELPPMPPPDQPPFFQSKSEPGSPWTIKGAIVPSPPLVKMPVQVLLTITDVRGEHLRDATVTGRPWMPLMGHGDGEIAFTRSDSGIWSGQTSFSMPGDWDVVLTITSGGQTTKHTFSFVVRETQ